MSGLGTEIIQLFEGLGTAGLLFSLFLIFYVDAIIIPLLPEIFAVLIFQAGDATLEWGLTVLFLAEVAEVLGNTTLYLVVRRVGLPKRLRAAMNKWTDILLAEREMLILTNRIAPAVPFVGAFMAACEWDYRRSVLFIVVGGLAKYSALLLLVGAFRWVYPEDLAANLTLIFVIVFVAVSAAVALLRRRRMLAAENE